MKIIVLFIIVCSIIFNIYAQNTSNWKILNDGMGGLPYNINLINEKVGWITGGRLILKTEDGGENWKEIEIMLSNDIDLNVIKMTSETNGWAWASDNATKYIKIYRTENSGQTWQLVFEPNNDYWYYLQSAAGDSVAFVVGWYTSDNLGIILKTTDAGDNWISMNPNLQDRQLYEIQIINSDLALVLGRVVDDRDGETKDREVSILRTKNGGESWDETLLNEFSETARIYNLQYVNDSSAYFLTKGAIDDPDKYYLYASTDSGKSWSSIFETEDDIIDYHFLDSETCFAMRTDSLFNTIIMKSTDGGVSWEDITVSNFPANKIYFLNPAIGFCIAGNDLWKTTDGGNTWVQKIFTYPFNDIEFVNNQKGFACGGFTFGHGSKGDLFTTNDGGRTWRHILRLSEMKTCMFLNHSIGLLTDRGGEIRKTIDSGEHWTVCYENNFDSTGYNIYGIDIAILNEKVFFAAGHGSWSVDSSGAIILGTTDSGTTWNLNWRYPSSEEYWYNLNSIHSAGTIAWAVGEQGMIVKYTEEDKWQLRSSVTDLPLNDVFFCDDQHGWIAGGYGEHLILLKTTNSGENWREILDFNYKINDMFFEDSLQGWAVGSDISGGIIIETNDGGDNWSAIVEDLSAELTAIHFKDGVGWAVGGNGLVLRTDNWNTWIDQNSGEILPDNFTLSQNYPNPFNPKTVISYQLPKTSDAELSVYNILGQRIATLVSVKQPAGAYKVEWDASGYSSGLYFYRLETDNGFAQTKKLIFLK